MGNIQPTGTSSKSTPPNTPRRTSVPNFQEVAFGNTVQPMEGHAQGALSLTITPLPSNATVSVLTPQQISALGPPVRPRPQIVLGELGCPLTLTGESATLTANVTGLEPGTSLAGVFCSILSLALADERGLVNDPSVSLKSCPGGGARLRITAKLPTRAEFRRGLRNTGGPLQHRADKHYEFHSRVRWAVGRARNLLCNMLDLGLDSEQIKLLKRFKSIRESLSSSDWKFDIQSAQAPYPSDVKNRKKCIKVFLGAGLHEAALVLLQDFVCNSKLEATFARDYVVKDKFKLTFPFKPKNLTFKSGENTDLRWLRAFICVNIYPADPYVAARIVLREFLTTDNDSSELQEYQLLVIKTLQETASNLDEAERSAMLRRLLDLPGVDRGDLFRNPKAKKLLGSAFPELLKSDGGTLGPLCALEMHYQEILWKSMKRLTEKFVLGGETPDQLEILARSPYTPISADSIDLADAATYCAGQVNTAIGVLKFLASREELSDKQKQRIIALCDQIKMAVRFDPDPKIAESFDSVVEKTDAILAGLLAPASGEKKPDAGA